MADNPGNGKDRKIFQQMDVRATTKNSITIGWKLSKSNGTLGRMILRGYTVKYHAVGSTIKHDVDSLGPSLVTYVIKHLHENTIYEICVRALMKFSDDVETIHEGMDSSDRQSALIPQGSVDYSPAIDKSSNDIHLIQEPNNDSDTFPVRSSEVLSTSSSPGHSLELPGVKNLDSGYESCIVSSTASSSLSLALGSTLGAFLALGVIVFFVLVAKWQHKNRRQRLKKRWIASNISASERSQRLTFNPELLQMDDLISCDPCDVGNGPWSPDEIDVKEVDRARDNLESDEIELNALDLDGDLLLLDETDHQDGCDLQTRRSKEAIDALRRILQDENICAESFVISTPSVKDGSESYNLLVPLSSAQSLLPYLVDNEDEEFPVSTQNRHHYHQNRSAGNSRMAESVRKLKFKKHFTIDYSGCSSELHPDQKGCLHLDNALQQQVNCSFAAKQSRLFKLQTLKTVECNSSLDTDYDDCPDKPISESHSNGEHSMQSEDAKDRLCFVNEQGNNDNNVHQQDYPMQPDTTENGGNADNDSGTLRRSFSVEW